MRSGARIAPLRAWAATAIAVVAVGVATGGVSAGAASFTVTNTGDSGAGSLRGALAKAKAAAGQDVITFAPRVTGSITLTSGPLTIDSPVKIDGPGAGVLTVSGDDKRRVFSIVAGVKAKILGLTISDGRIAGGDVDLLPRAGGKGGAGGSGGGGAGGNGGSDIGSDVTGPEALGAGIFNQGQLLLDHVVVSNNRGLAGDGGIADAEGGDGGSGGVPTGGPGGNGGDAQTGQGQAGAVLGVGIANEGSMTLRDSSVADNTGVGGRGGAAIASGGNGGHGGDGATATGGVAGEATATGANGGDVRGAGIFNSGRLTIERSTVSGNTAIGGDGGDARARAGDGGDSGTNAAPGGAGGSATAVGGTGGSALGAGIVNSGTLEARNATISGNATLPGGNGSSGARGGADGTGAVGGAAGTASATHGPGGEAHGGGIEALAGSANLLSLTISRNAADAGANVAAIVAPTVENTILADPRGAGKNCIGSLSSGGHNIQSDASCGLARSTDQSKVNPRLGSLKDNGGPTSTQALPSNSPAVDAGVSAGLTTDQRGKPRPKDLGGVPNRFGSRGADVGAFELQAR